MLPTPSRLPAPRKEGSVEDYSKDRPGGLREAHRQSMQSERHEAKRLQAARSARWEQRRRDTGELREPVARSSSRMLTRPRGLGEAQLSTRRLSCPSSEAEPPRLSTQTLSADGAMPSAARLPAPGLLSCTPQGRDESAMRQKQRAAERRAQVRISTRAHRVCMCIHAYPLTCLA